MLDDLGRFLVTVNMICCKANCPPLKLIKSYPTPNTHLCNTSSI